HAPDPCPPDEPGASAGGRRGIRGPARRRRATADAACPRPGIHRFLRRPAFLHGRSARRFFPGPGAHRMAGLSAPPPRITGLDWTGVDYFCTTRGGGVSAQCYASLNLGLHAGDDAARVLENRRRLEAMLPDSPLWLNQVHGIQVCDADALAEAGGAPTADAAVTVRKSRVLAVMTADCLPVVMADTAGRALGVAH